MIAFLLALAVPVMAQEAKPAVVDPVVTKVPGQISQRTDYLESEVGQLLSGKPTITGVPNFQNGFAVNGVAGTPMLTTSTDTVSAAKTFTSSVTTSDAGLFNVVASTVNSSKQTSITLSGLNGNTDKAWFIHVRGVIEGGSDGQLPLLQFNGDSGANYHAIIYRDYSAATNGAAATTGIPFHWVTFTATQHIDSTFWVTAEVTNTAFLTMKRSMHGESGYWSDNPDGGMTRFGGGWSDVSTNITSLTFAFAGGKFSGSIHVYKAQY